MSIFFTSPEHKYRLAAAIQGMDKIWENGKLDPEYTAALYILTAHLGTWDRTKSYVTKHGISFEEMLKEQDFSGGYSVLIMLASNLFNSNAHVDPIEFLRLDEENYKLALNAINIRRYSMHMNDFK